MKLNPFEQGRADARNKVRQGNPFPVFTQRWALYNRGYNTFDVFSGEQSSTMADWRRDNPEPKHGCGHMQGRGAA